NVADLPRPFARGCRAVSYFVRATGLGDRQERLAARRRDQEGCVVVDDGARCPSPDERHAYVVAFSIERERALNESSLVVRRDVAGIENDPAIRFHDNARFGVAFGMETEADQVAT